MTPHPDPDALNLLARCELFSDLDPSRLTPADLDALRPEVSIMRLARGEILLHQGEASDCMFALVSGRLQVFVEGREGERNLVGELRAGETVGEIGLIDGNPRMGTVIASRDSLLVRVSEAGFNRLVLWNADSLLKIARAEATRMRAMGQRRHPAATVRTIAVTGAAAGADLERFTEGLCRALGEIGSVLHLDSSRYRAAFGDAASGEAVAGWLTAMENAHRFIVCSADAAPSPWTLHCLRQADRILSVRDGSDAPELSATERIVFDGLRTGQMPPVELVLLHADNGSVFPHTSRWLAGREVLRHHHVRTQVEADTGRVARFLAGQAMGLALGGGGVRGFAHIGILRALGEAGIPVDMTGGVSMGAIVAALYAMGCDSEELLRRVRREMTKKMTQDVALPIVALSTGRKFRRVLENFFGNCEVEDLGLGYFCSCCNLSTGEIVVHRRGPLVRAVHASNAIPVVLPPVLSNGQMLIDGGVLNNQPGDILKQLCGGPVMVSNVSPRRGATVDAAFEEMPSAWRILRSRLNPFESAIKVPGIMSTMVRTLMVASFGKSREVEGIADFYLRPPIDRFRVDDYDRVEEIAETGYEYARTEIAAWKQTGRYPVTAATP